MKSAGIGCRRRRAAVARPIEHMRDGPTVRPCNDVVRLCNSGTRRGRGARRRHGCGHGVAHGTAEIHVACAVCGQAGIRPVSDIGSDAERLLDFIRHTIAVEYLSYRRVRFKAVGDRGEGFAIREI
jgi:uncharacterized spore protein YtfJ